MSKIPDNIIEQVKNNNRAAQKQLYYLSKNYLKSVALRYCATTQDARDVVQETYLKIFKSIKSFDKNKGSFKAWSTRILINESYTILRKKANLESYTYQTKIHHSIQEFNFDKITIDEVREIMNKLKEDHKLVINMYFFEQYSYREMSEILEIKESTIRSKVTRAKAELLKFWTDYNNVNYEY